MKPAKKLMLKKETLAELTSDQLRVVFGAYAVNTNSCSCTSCGCSCDRGTCLVATLTDSVTETTGRLIVVGC